MFCSPPRYNLKISIHALLAESDRTGAPQLVVVSTFLSTLSLRRATSMRIDTGNSTGEFLSTLSLRRATLRQTFNIERIKYFYPRSPCGERQPQNEIIAYDNGFLSTLSLRRATADCPSITVLHCISIHALLAESDLILHMAHLMEHLFLSTLSLRRATL